jgi:hypothetical protein
MNTTRVAALSAAVWLACGTAVMPALGFLKDGLQPGDVIGRMSATLAVSD